MTPSNISAGVSGTKIYTTGYLKHPIYCKAKVGTKGSRVAVEYSRSDVLKCEQNASSLPKIIQAKCTVCCSVRRSIDTMLNIELQAESHF